MATNRKLAIASTAAVVVLAVAGGTAASAAGQGMSAAKGSPSSSMSPKPGQPGKDPDRQTLLREVAAGLHVSVAVLENALRDMKMTSGRLGVDPTDPRVVAVFAKDLHITDANALKVIKEIVGNPGKARPVKSPPSGTTPPPAKSPAPSGTA